jgi:phosphate transport system substrate-binding protein
MRSLATPLAVLVTVSTPAGCGKNKEVVAVDGSSTVFPITESVAEAYRGQGDARVTVGVSGTGGGFKKLCNGEVALIGASRPIKPSEVQQCEAENVEYIELPVAYDGIAVVVHADNDWVSQLTVEELRKIWEPQAQGKVKRWSDVRPDWPNEELHLFGPGVDSGTYDYFTKAIVGTEHASRGDFTSSEDDNVIVVGVSSDPNALGFFGYAYYRENKDKLKVLGIDDGIDDNGEGAIEPSNETVAGGTYQPLSRPIFIYVSNAAVANKPVADFVDFYLERSPDLAANVGYISLSDNAYALVRERFTARTTGSLFDGQGSKVGVTVDQLLAGD